MASCQMFLRKLWLPPLLKKPDLSVNEPQNFRPVSNLPFLSKILEKLVSLQLLKHIDSYKLRDKFQSAYRPSHSTETALLKVTNDIKNIIDNKQVCLLAMLDLSAAFDTIDHQILVKRLENDFGISGMALQWFSSYLANRFQAVKIGRELSEYVPLGFGVPQGSVLGPLLFTLYTQPLTRILEKHGMQFHFYADDCQLYKGARGQDLSQVVNAMENCISEVKQWMTSNMLKINDDKTEIIIFGTRSSLVKIGNVTVNVNGHSIPACERVKNLGVVLDRELSMASQISSLCKNTFLSLKRIRNVRKYLTTDVTKTLVSSLTLSRIDYCNALLTGIPDCSLSKLQICQNSAARLIKKVGRRISAKPLLHSLHWLPIRSRIRYKIAVFCFKCLNDLAPLYLSELLQVHKPLRSLRSSADDKTLVIPRKNLKTYGDRSFAYFAPSVWNSLPYDIRCSKNIEIFKKRLKHFLFLNEYDCL